MRRLLIFVPILIVAALAGSGILIDRLFINPHPPTYEIVISGAEGIFCGFALVGLFAIGSILCNEFAGKE